MNFMTIDECVRSYPAIGNSFAGPSRTDKYMQVSTETYLKDLALDGLQPYKVQGKNCRLTAKKQYAEHAVFLTNPDWLKEGNDYFPTIVMVNSHNGSTSVRFYIGIYRIVCSNGLVVGTSIFAPIRIRHVHANRARLHAAYNQLVKQIGTLDTIITMMKNSIVDIETEAHFVDEAVRLRWGNNTPQNKKFQSHSFNLARRFEDSKPNVWTLYNRVQENIVNKGRGYRKVTAVDKNIKINQGLWDAAIQLTS